MQRRQWRRVAVVLVVVLGPIAAFVMVLRPVYVTPRADSPAPADAIVVLGGAHDGREELGLDLAREGFARQVVFSNPYEGSAMLNRICHGGYSFEVSCFDPDPATTRGEGRQIARLAAAEDWRKVIVVTFTPHLSRARYIIDKCWDGELLMVENPADLAPAQWGYNFVYQSFGYARAFFEDC